MSHKKPTFSIIIPTLNEEKYLPHLLHDLSMQTFNDFEVIVVDGKSKDKTVELAKKTIKRNSLVIIISPLANVAQQRNLGIQKAQGRWLLFIDADSRIPVYFLEGIKYQLAKNGVIDVFTSLLAADEDSNLTLLFAKTINLGLLLQEKSSKQYAIGAFIGATREVCQTIKFNQTVKLGEDSEFIREATAKGFQFRIFKDPVYVFSFRRLRKEGVLKMLAIDTKAIYKDLMNQKEVNNDYGYVMKGGDYYENTNTAIHLEYMQKAMKLTKTQIKRLNDFFKKLS
jgi:glycosyltransferase involved in cell wall biosynthesis